MMRHSKSCIPDLSCFISPAGKRVKDVFEPRFNGHKIILDKVGTLDIQEQIESYAPYTDLNYMLHRLKVGDTSVLRNSNPLYGDFSGLPTNPLDAVNLVHSAEQAFLVLPVEEKQKYNNDYRVWLSAVFSGSAMRRYGSLSNENDGLVPAESVKEE